MYGDETVKHREVKLYKDALLCKGSGSFSSYPSHGGPLNLLCILTVIKTHL